jgi:hypothetical protein
MLVHKRAHLFWMNLGGTTEDKISCPIVILDRSFFIFYHPYAVCTANKGLLKQ